MKKRSHLLLTHWIDSIIIMAVAAILYMILISICNVLFMRASNFISCFGICGIYIIILFISGAIGLFFPYQIKSVCSSIAKTPFHCGLVFKVIGAIVLLYLATKVFKDICSNIPIYFPDIVDILTVLIIFIFALIFALIVSWISATLKLYSPDSAKKKQQLPNNQQRYLDTWLTDDQPITNQSENLFSEYSVIAERMLSRLIKTPESQLGCFPNIALIGPYGSGKTSICNLVEDVYGAKPKEDSTIPKVLFCRFEAWQFITPEAAVSNLLRTITDRICEDVDASELISIPWDYVQAIEGIGGFWARLVAFFLRRTDDPIIIAQRIGDLLVRLNLRLIIFVDDLDRIETNYNLVQHAITQALNQLQNVPNLQYIISAGQIPTATKSPDNDKMTLDLLKLTRFQELVPVLSAESVLVRFRDLRDKILQDNSIYHLWSYIGVSQDDPLKYRSYRKLLGYNSYSYSDLIVELASTPRSLKCTLRESITAWEHGLKGEVDWYDLILANALKAAEPDIYEWILREPTTFLYELSILIDSQKEQDIKDEIDRINSRLMTCIQSKETSRIKIVTKTLEILFPAFKSRLNPSSTYSSDSLDVTQKLACQPIRRLSYLGRFSAGTLPENEIPDQPTLQYICKLEQGDFDRAEFEKLYLSSYEKLSGDINIFIRFSPLLSIDKALIICDTILAWLAVPEHANLWQPPEKFITDMMPDVIDILENSGRQTDAHDQRREKRPILENWMNAKIQEYGSCAPLIAGTLLNYSKKLFAAELHDNFKQQLAELIYKDIVKGSATFYSRLLPNRYSLAWLLGLITKHKNFDNFKTELTHKLILEADNDSSNRLKGMIVLTLVSIKTPVRSGEIPIEQYEFSVNEADGDKKYDMSLMRPALEKWQNMKFEDIVADRAFGHIATAYKLDRSNAIEEN